MSNIKKIIIFVLIFSFLNCTFLFAHEKSNFGVQIINIHNKGEIIYLMDKNGNIVRLSSEMDDIVFDNLINFSTINASGSEFINPIESDEIIPYLKFSLPYDTKVKKICGNFFLTMDGRVFLYTGRNSRYLIDVYNVEDIKTLSDKVVVLYNQDGTVKIWSNGSNGISGLIFKEEILDAVVYDDDILLIIKKDGKIVGIGDGFNRISSTVSTIVNAKKFIKEEENLYILTFDDVVIPIYEKYFKAPKEYLSNISNIVIDKFSTEANNFYKSYFITTDGRVYYHVQSDNEISSFNKNKIEYMNTFDNVQNVYESGYLTIVLHRDGSITIPYDIEHELNGITDVSDVILQNQSYVVYLNDGQVITSLENFVLNKIDIPVIDNDEEMTIYNYLNKMFANILNRYINDEEFENLQSYILTSKSNFEQIIKDVCLDRKFVMLDKSYDEIINNLYNSILNTFPSEEEYTHINIVIIENMIKEDRNKYEIINSILDYIFENPIFENISSKFVQI